MMMMMMMMMMVVVVVVVLCYMCVALDDLFIVATDISNKVLCWLPVSTLSIS
jgi:hypothetical protein